MDRDEPEILSLELLEALPDPPAPKPSEAALGEVDGGQPTEAPPIVAELNGQAYPGGMVLKATSGDGTSAWAKAAFDGEVGKLAASTPGTDRNINLNKASFALGQIVAGGNLSQTEVEATLQRVGEQIGLEASECRSTIRSGIDAGKLEPRTPPERASFQGKKASASYGAEDCPEPPEIEADDVATIDDLIRAGAQVEWRWDGWIPVGVVVAIAAKGGTGKTRFCADIARRVRHERYWPDGTPIMLPPESLFLWVVADNHHDEMVTLTQTFGITDIVRINASKADPYGGVSLDTREDYLALEGRIKAVRPAFVIVDTVGNATDRNLSRQEDAKAFYWPLQVMARKYRTSILCLTHLNASGHFLGRRVMEKVRVAIRIDQFGEDEKRRLEAIKSFSKRPPALGMTMGDAGNDYDDDPPEAPEEGSGGFKPGPKPPSEVELNAMKWLKEFLHSGPKRVSITRDAAEKDKIYSDTLYVAKKLLNVHEFSAQKYKWWSLTKEEEF